MDNEFLSTPLLTSSKKARTVKNSIEKDELIRGLELKNNKLRTEIIKIQNVIDENLQSEPDDKPKERQPIMRSEQNQATMAKELANCYKKIKMYEYQISKIEEAQASMNVIHKVKQIESIIKEKKAMTERLKHKLHSEQKQIADNIKKLNNGNRQQEIQKKIKSMTDEIKFLREKQKEQEGKDQIKQTNMKKQFEFVKRLENELRDMGVSQGELEEIKAKAVKMVQPTPITESYVSKTSQTKKEDEGHGIEDRTIDHYKQIQNEIKLLDKMQLDYEKKTQQAENEKEKAVQYNSETRDRLLQIEDEIQKIQREILIQKGNVLPSNMKPLRPLRSVSSHYMSSNKDKKMPVKNHSIGKGSKTLNHLLKFDEVGMTSDKGQRFTDRNILGKNKLNTKMTGLSIFINAQNQAISGVQATYNNSKKGGEYLKRDREAKEKQYKEESINCQEGEWFKSMTGTLTPQDKLESLYVITNKGQSKRFGEPKTTNKAFSFDIGPDEVPVCIFGSLLVQKQVGKWENSIVEHFGIEVNSEQAKKGQLASESLEL